MAKVLVTESNLASIANAIRGKNGTQNTYKPGQMAEAITNIPTGITPTGTINIDQNGTVDVTNYALAAVSVSGGGGGATILSGTSEPTSAQGSNGDIYLQYIDDSQLPSGFESVEYLESSGAQYIDTDIPCNTSDLACEVIWMPTYGYTNDRGIFGGAWATNGFFMMLDGGYCKMHDGGAVSTFTSAGAISTAKYTTFKAEHGVGVTIDGTLYALVSTGANTSDTLKVLGGLDGSRAARGRLKRCKIWSGSTLLAEMYPALDANNTPCLYDVIRNQAYYNAGSGTFSYGGTGNSITAALLKVAGAWQNLIGSKITDVGGVSA